MTFQTTCASPMRTVALLSDTHGYLDARVREAASACDYIVHAGDIGGAGVLQALGGAARGFIAVRGNNDVPEKWPPSERGLLRDLPDAAEVALPGGLLVVTHGDRVLPAKQRHARLRRAYPEARAIVYGHSHRLVADCSVRPWVLNPGAAGRARTYGGPSWLMLFAAEDRWRLRMFRYA